MVVEDPALAMAKQGLSRGALDDGEAEESERSDAIARGRVGRFFRVREPIVSPVAAGKSSAASVDGVSLPINRGSDVCEAVPYLLYE